MIHLMSEICVSVRVCECRRMCAKLPLPDADDADRPSIDFIIMMVDLSNRERFLTVNCLFYLYSLFTNIL